MRTLGNKSFGIASRQAAWEVLLSVAAGAYADAALERTFRKFSLSTKDRGLVKEISFGAIRRRLWLDSWIDLLAKVKSSQQPPPLRWILHIGIYQIFLMDRIPDAAAVNTSVELIKSGELARLAPVVNGVLRAAIRAKDSGMKLPLPSDPVGRLANAQSLPFWLAKDLMRWRGTLGAEEVAIAFNKVPALDLRVNRLSSSPESLHNAFQAVGLKTSLIEGAPDGLQIVSSAGDLRNLPGYKNGDWCVQDRSAQWVAPLLDVQKGERVLDACAAPGGKTTHIAELMANTGEIWAVDRSSVRLKSVVDNVQRLGVKTINYLAADSTKLLDLKPNWKRYFNRILLDAPCSGLGTLARNPDARWRVTRDDINGLLELQFKLLEGILPLLKPGGRIVYSTCTINPKENFDQTAFFLSRHSELKLSYEKQTWPKQSGEGDGFYAAVLDLE